MVKLFAGGFPRDLEEIELKDIFEQFGTVESVNIVRDKHTGISRRFGFVVMPNEEEASIALQSLHEASIDQDVISVTYADDRKKEKPAPPKPAARKIEYKAKPKIYQKVTRPGERVGGKRPRKRI
ncbi:MAG: RNA recognition motif domain-containing protein [Arcticibacter sp.]